MQKNFVRQLLASLFLLSCTMTNAATITSGSLTLDVNESNGAIDALSGYGVDWFNAGTYVSNYGFYDGSVFNVNATSGGSSIAPGALAVDSVVANSNSVFLTGSYNTFFAFTRSYSIVAGSPNVISLETSLTNLSGAFASIVGFETFDPDPTGFYTYNDVQTSSTGYDVAMARDDLTDLTFLIGSSGASATAAGNPFQINSISGLNNFMNTPFDGNGALADSGVHLGFEYNLDVDQTITTTAFLAVSDSGFAGAVSTLDNATSVSEPSTLAVFALFLLGIAFRGVLRIA